MIEKLNIPIRDKLTKKIEYMLWLDEGIWWKSEFDDKDNKIYSQYYDNTWIKRKYDDRGNVIFFKRHNNQWGKLEYNNEADIIYYENSEGYISDDRKTKHNNTK